MSKVEHVYCLEEKKSTVWFYIYFSCFDTALIWLILALIRIEDFRRIENVDCFLKDNVS